MKGLISQEQYVSRAMPKKVYKPKDGFVTMSPREIRQRLIDLIIWVLAVLVFFSLFIIH